MPRKKPIKLHFKGFDEVKKTPVPDAHGLKSRGEPCKFPGRFDNRVHKIRKTNSIWGNLSS